MERYETSRWLTFGIDDVTSTIILLRVLDTDDVKQKNKNIIIIISLVY